jgi:hypothetical protein
MTTIRRSAVALAVLVLVAGFGGCTGGRAGYGKATQGTFLTACNPDRDGARDVVCRCAYDEVTKRYSYDEYVGLNKDLEADRNAIPNEIVALVAACAVPPTTSTSTTASSSSSSESSSSASSSSSR